MTQEEPEFIPTDPQEYLRLVMLLDEVRDRVVPYQVHLLMMTAVGEAIASVDFADEPATTDEILTRLDTWLQFALTELESLEDPQAVRDALRGFRAMVADWQRTFQERADHTSDRD